MAEGTPKQILAHPKSLTGQYLSGRKQVAVPKKRREGNGKSLQIVNATANNLKNVTVSIPLGKMVCITGVSGSGKSTLMSDIYIRTALAAKLMGAHVKAGEHEKIEGIEHLDKIINIDQSPIGRTPRSNPGTYTGLFDEIRKLLQNCRKARCAVTSREDSLSTSTADAAKPARDRVSCELKCSFCRMCMCLAMYATANALIARPCR
jgi:excinuclease ABC subunit A